MLFDIEIDNPPLRYFSCDFYRSLGAVYSSVRFTHQKTFNFAHQGVLCIHTFDVTYAVDGA